jgi:hypothetical protein
MGLHGKKCFTLDGLNPEYSGNSSATLSLPAPEEMGGDPTSSRVQGLRRGDGLE